MLTFIIGLVLQPANPQPAPLASAKAITSQGQAASGAPKFVAADVRRLKLRAGQTYPDRAERLECGEFTAAFVRIIGLFIYGCIARAETVSPLHFATAIQIFAGGIELKPLLSPFLNENRPASLLKTFWTFFNAGHRLVFTNVKALKFKIRGAFSKSISRSAAVSRGPAASLDCMKFHFLFLAVSLACSGCLPVRWQDTPHVTGAVLDAASKEPLVGARLYYADFPKREVHTGLDGQFDFPRIAHWGLLVLLPIDRIPPHSILTVEASGYVPTNTVFFGWYSHTNKVFYLNNR